MSDRIFYDTQQQLGPPTETLAPVDSLFYETERDLGPLPTGCWRMDLDEVPAPIVPWPVGGFHVTGPGDAMLPAPVYHPYDQPTIEFDRTPAESWWRNVLAQPVGLLWVVLAVAALAIVACGWLLL